MSGGTHTPTIRGGLSPAEAAALGHYRLEGLAARVFDAIAASGRDPEALAPGDLDAFEHMHTGGAQATRRVVAALRPQPGEVLLDIGCGIGGVTRAIARAGGGHVVGLDLNEDFADLAAELSRRSGLGERTRFVTGSALNLPFRDASMDGAVLMHVGLNVADKGRMLAEAFRVLRPGGRLVVCDLMLGPVAEPLVYPVPWASDAAVSHLVEPAVYRDLGAAAGFVLLSELDYYAETFTAPVNAIGPRQDRIGPDLLMGAEAARKVRNLKLNLDAGRVVPVQMVFARP